MGGALGLLHPVALHDLAVAVDADVPRATRLALAVQHGRVRHIVVLEHALFKLTLWVKVLLENKIHYEEPSAPEKRLKWRE